MSECVEACLDDHIELFNQYSDNLIEHAKSLEARIEALEKAAIDAVQGYEAYAESGFEEVLDPPMMALAALLQEPTND